MSGLLGQNSNVGKLKTLSGALDTMVRTEPALQLLRKELREELEQVRRGRGLCSTRLGLRVGGVCMWIHTCVSTPHRNANSDFLICIVKLLNASLIYSVSFIF